MDELRSLFTDITVSNCSTRCYPNKLPLLTKVLLDNDENGGSRSLFVPSLRRIYKKYLRSLYGITPFTAVPKRAYSLCIPRIKKIDGINTE